MLHVDYIDNFETKALDAIPDLSGEAERVDIAVAFLSFRGWIGLKPCLTAAAARELRRVRAEALPKMKGGLRALYRTLELPGANPLKDAHAALDAAVLTAYGFNAKRDLLAQLLALNQEAAAKIEKGEPVMPPGVPHNYPDAKKLVTHDCIKQ